MKGIEEEHLVHGTHSKLHMGCLQLGDIQDAASAESL